MAVEFTSATQRFQATTGLPTTTCTITCWACLDVSQATWQALWDLTTTGYPAARSQLAVGPGGDIWLLDSNTNTVGGFATTVGTWMRLGVSLSGSTCVVYFGTTTPGALSTATIGTFVPSSAPTQLSIGRDGASTSLYFPGRLAALKMWDQVLTQAEITTELVQYRPVRTANLLHHHPLVKTETTDYSGNGYALSGGTGSATADGPPIPWGARRRPRVALTPALPTVDAGKDVFGTAGFEFAIQAVETGGGITVRSWTVVSGPAEVATEIGTTSLLSWFPTTPGTYELEYRVTNPAGQGYDTVYVTVTATGTVVASASISGTTTTLTCAKPTGAASGDVLLAVQSGNFNDLDLMNPPVAWQPLFAYDVGMDSLHVKGWTLTAGGSEPSTYDFTQGTGSAGVVTIVAMRGVVEGGVRWELVPDATTTTTRTCPTVEGAVDGSILLCGAMTDPAAARTWTPPTGMTEQADVQSGTTVTQSVASLLDPPDPTGTKDFTLSGTTAAPGGIQWSAVFPMPADPHRRGNNKSMFTVVRTT